MLILFFSINKTFFGFNLEINLSDLFKYSLIIFIEFISLANERAKFLILYFFAIFRARSSFSVRGKV